MIMEKEAGKEKYLGKIVTEGQNARTTKITGKLLIVMLAHVPAELFQNNVFHCQIQTILIILIIEAKMILNAELIQKIVRSNLIKEAMKKPGLHVMRLFVLIFLDVSYISKLP